MQIQRRCSQCILCIEVPLAYVQADRRPSWSEGGIVLVLVLLQRFAMDLAQNVRVRILGTLALLGDVG